MKNFLRLLLPLILGSVAATLLLAAPVIARPLAQDPTAYDVPTYELPTGYPNNDLTPYVDPGQFSPTPSASVTLTLTPGPSPTASPPGFIASATPTSGMTLSATPTSGLTPSATSTLGRNLFGTEDAEMGEARLTPAQSETPEPNKTLTAIETPTATTIPAEDASFNLNKGWFTAGILLPPFILLCAWLIQRARRSGEFG
jgi:hypothetical protein